MRGTIAFFRTATHRTFSGGVARVNIGDGDAAPLRFVGDKLPQLIERPAVHCGALRLANRYPVADAAQVFQGDPAASVLSLFHNAFADRVVDVCGKATLLARQLLEATLRAARALALQLLAQAPVTKAHGLNRRPRVHDAIAIYSDIHDAQVNAEKAVRVKRRFFGYLAGRREVEVALAIDQVAFALLVCQQGQLVCAGHEGHVLSTAQQPDRHRSIGHAPVQDAAVVGDAAVFSEVALRLPILFVGVDNLADAADGHLRREGKPGANLVVNELMDTVLRPDPVTPDNGADGVAGGVGRRQRFEEQNTLLGGWLQLDYRGQLHRSSIAQNFCPIRQTRGEGVSSPR